MKDIPSMYASLVFNDKVMKERLSNDVYSALKKTVESKKNLDLELANSVASAMKDWAIEKGATHFTHWFQPMTGITAEKHDSFIAPKNEGVIMEFSGKSLVQGEPDASSLPSGGLRATFEARGYTAWDPTSYAFIKDGSLCIPTAFCAYNGQALDKKTPLLRSMQAINKQALRVLKLFGREDVTSVITTVGAEQEYFLVDKDMADSRPDLVYCGRTLFGAKPPKGQEMDDHYFGAIKPKVSEFMKELDEELWKLGVPAKTKHNETAPAQHELACVYETTNIATDHNQLVMALMKSIAQKHNMKCLLHEKPFDAVNGSGKHNNWSLNTNTGINLLEPGATPYENAQFILFLTAVIKAVDEYQGLLRLSASSASNDLRLGALEAPPAIVSMSLGEELTAILEAIEKDSAYTNKEKSTIEIGVDFIPHFPKDTTDRNRTSPFAFTGNKFEFRMLGSSFSISGPNIILNTIVAEALSQFADELEKSKNFKDDLSALIKRNIKEHKRIIYNGNNYTEDWIREAKKRGLENLTSTVDALPKFIEKKSINLFQKHGVFTETEIRSRFEILLDNYCKTVRIEALTMIQMVKNGVIPSAISYEKELSKVVSLKNEIGVTSKTETAILKDITKLLDDAYSSLNRLEKDTTNISLEPYSIDTAKFYRNTIIASMCKLRTSVDTLETIIPKQYLAFPTSSDLIYSVK